jgi:glycine cleavage system H protein
MSKIPEKLKYSKEHEWVKLEGDLVVIGITDHAQEKLGEIVYLELPAKGERIDKEEAFGVVESTKAVSDIYAPVTGEIVEVNTGLVTTPERINKDPYEDGWLVKVKVSDKNDLNGLLTEKEYADFLKEEG